MSGPQKQQADFGVLQGLRDPCGDEGGEDADRVGSATNAGDHAGGESPLRRECLLSMVRAIATPAMVPAGESEPKAGDFKAAGVYPE